MTLRDSWLRRPYMVYWYDGCLHSPRTRSTSLTRRPWIEIEATSPPLGCTGYFVNPIFGDLWCTQILCMSERQRCAQILIFAYSLPMFCSLRLWQTPVLRYHRQYGLARVLGLRLFIYVSSEISPCLCGRAVRRSSHSWLQAVISPERAVQDNVSP